ncbi:hypothetical protein [Brevibacillus gelatini]|nr:hypothetical protein [Brevibacillus gelatini]
MLTLALDPADLLLSVAKELVRTGEIRASQDCWSDTDSLGRLLPNIFPVG